MMADEELTLVVDALIIDMVCCCCWVSNGEGVVRLRLGGPIGVIDRPLAGVPMGAFIDVVDWVMAADVMIDDAIDRELAPVAIADADEVLPTLAMTTASFNLGDSVKFVLDAERLLILGAPMPPACGAVVGFFESGPMLPLELLNFDANVPGGPVDINEAAVNVVVVEATEPLAAELAFLMEFFSAWMAFVGAVDEAAVPAALLVAFI
jgi:hypothetical protein